MGEVTVEKNDELVMKLLHYFITEQGYNPIVLHGAKNEIWLENIDASYGIVRINTGYIHNKEQLDFDLFKTKSILGKIKKKMMTMHMNVLSFYLNMGENVSFENGENSIANVTCIQLTKIDDLNEHPLLLEAFPNITKKTTYTEKGMDLFIKLTREINKKSEEDAMRAEQVFRMKKPVITYLLIAINMFVFICMYLFGNGSQDPFTLLNFGANYGDLVRAGEYYRLFTCAFLHIGVLHLFVNMYSLYVIGPQLESFLGKTKFLIVYLFSALSGSLLSICFTDGVSAGASGALFGLLGSLLYFGYHYRIYLGSVMKSQIIPIIILNLLMGFFVGGVDNAAHIGGLIGGALITMALGVKYKSTTFEKINGWILTAIFLGFVIYAGFIGL